MAFQMAFSNDDGTDYPDSYWIPAQVNLCLVENTGFVVFNGYKNQAAYLAGKRSIGQKSYNVDSGSFVKYFEQAVMAAEGKSPMIQAYAYAMKTLDPPNPDNQKRDDGSSFFAAATVV